MSLHRLPPGPVDLRAIDPASTPGFTGDKAAGKEALAGLGDELSDLQERLFAEGATGSRRRLLLVLQGMDTSGKGGVLRHTVGLIDPQGVRITSFKAPSEEEKRHHFLWRVKRALPAPGHVGVFDRSHYEDVLIVKVHEWAESRTIEARYDQINEFEAELAADGVVIVKCMLHISAEKQHERLAERSGQSRTSTGSTTRATSTSVGTGPTTGRPTRPPWSGRTPRSRRGTWSRRTASGSATWPSASSCWTRCEG